MSSMIKAPPPMINLGGAPGAFPLPRPTGPMPGAAPGPGPGAPGPGDEGPSDSDSGDVVSLLKKAMALVQQASNAEKDDQDAAAIHQIASDLAKQIGAEQGLADKAMGAGPGVKLIRKSGGGGV